MCQQVFVDPRVTQCVTGSVHVGGAGGACGRRNTCRAAVHVLQMAKLWYRNQHKCRGNGDARTANAHTSYRRHDPP